MTDKLDLANPIWRLQNLYSCREQGSGKGIPYVPKPEQMEVYRHLEQSPTETAYIIKSRRIGFSTALNIYQADKLTFNQGWRGTLIDLKQDDATKKMNEQIRFAWDSLPPSIKSKYRTIKRNDSELRIALLDEDDSEDSVIFATVSARGGDCSMLHVSEMGPIAAKDAPRAKEIVTGAFPAASEGRKVVETTWMGGKSGELWELVKPILEKDPNAEGRIFFFPWHGDPQSVKTDGMVTDEMEEYFRDLAEKTGKTFSQEQKKWFAAAKLTYRHETSREYPSTLEEAFSATVEGAIYAAEIDSLRTKGRILPFEVDKSSLVHTAWDLGAPINTVTWYFQIVGMDIRIVDVDLEFEGTITERVAKILGKGYNLGNHLLPHDAKATPTSGRTVQQDLESAGLKNTRIVPRTSDVWTGINQTLQNFPRFIFNTNTCEKGLAHLENYRMEAVSATGIVKEVPVHDKHSHASDGIRMISEGLQAGLIVNQTMSSSGARKPRVISAIGGR